jgi:hypothetical protein
MASHGSSSSPPPRRSFGWGTLLAWVLSLSLTAAGLRNALAPEPGLEAQARDLACAGPTLSPPALSAAATPSGAVSTTPAGKPASSATAAPAGKPAMPPATSTCRLQPTRWESGPIGRHFEFQGPPAPGTVRVQCRREYIALGDYRCLVVP